MESTTTGHQRSESRINRTLYLKHRREKLKNQQERPASSTSASSSNSSSKPPASSSSSSTLKGDEPPKTEKLVMQGVRVYINGYLCDTTDIEMKRTVTLAGGQVLFVSLSHTHPSNKSNLLHETQSDALKRDAHPNIPRPQRFQDPQAPNQERKEQSPHRETRVGR